MLHHAYKKRLPTWKNIIHAIRNRSGSEAVEMVYSTAALCVMIMCALMILGYTLQVNAVSHAGKRVARYIEVTGVAQQTDIDGLLSQLLPNRSDLGATVEVTDVTWYGGAGGAKIQLREPFTVQIDATYSIPLMTPGTGTSWTVDVPIHVSVNGQSEVYWK